MMEKLAAGALGTDHLGRIVRVEVWSAEDDGEPAEQSVSGMLLRAEHNLAAPHAPGTSITIWTASQRVVLALNAGHPVEVGDEPRVEPDAWAESLSAFV
ncbi:MAG: hypothetical protein NVV66_16355 [Cellulomonas sp.]|uniref:hypothetical protein n=1 Tax=Cellulomonas sp. TaxID=40001 RepID=UPI002584B6F8|nr:hypothetical protein [Cellulomonas sp.]MCR6706189.1 hypothetical protein [Cellulomonas sp.]